MYKSRDEYITLLKNNSEYLRNEFGVNSMRIFGSVARGENNNESDVDICVEMPPKMLILIKMKEYLENLLQNKVDIVRLHRNINPYLKSEINRDGILIFQ